MRIEKGLACALGVILALAPAAPSTAALLDHGFRIEGERMLRPGMWRFGGTFAVESDVAPGVESVTRKEVELDVIRFPMSWRYGFSPRIELGTDIQVEKDKGTSFDVADVFNGGGISYVDLIGKVKVFPWTTLLGHISALNDNDVYHGGDGFDFGLDVLVTLPLNLPIGIPNLMHVNAGIRFKQGEPDIDRNGRPDISGYTDPIHLGGSIIIVPLPRLGVVGEFYARRSLYDFEEEAEASLGVRYAATERTTAMFSLTHGFSAGSPDLAIRLGIEATYGSMTERQVMQQEKREKMPMEIKGEGPPPLEISVERLAAIAEAAYQRGDYLGAADAFAELVSRIPSDGRIYYNLGVCYYNLKDYARAEGDFIKANSLVPHDAEIHLYLGHCQFMQGRIEEARKNWLETIRLDPSNELAKYLLSSSPG